MFHVEHYFFCNLKIIYIVASDKERLIRQLDREENPDIEEIIRRYQTDNIDFLLVFYICSIITTLLLLH